MKGHAVAILMGSIVAACSTSPSPAPTSTSGTHFYCCAYENPPWVNATNCRRDAPSPADLRFIRGCDEYRCPLPLKPPALGISCPGSYQLDAGCCYPEPDATASDADVSEADVQAGGEAPADAVGLSDGGGKPVDAVTVEGAAGNE